MATKIENEFVEYKLDVKEMILASTFTDLQKSYLQTMRAEIARDVLNLSYDPDSANADREFQLKHQHLKGQLDILAVLINTSDDNQAKLAAMEQAQYAAQQANN